MGKDKIGFGIALSIALASLPVWRSGEKKGLNLFEFIKEHTIMARNRQWVQLKDKNTNDEIWVELQEGNLRSTLGYVDESGKHKEPLTAYI